MEDGSPGFEPDFLSGLTAGSIHCISRAVSADSPENPSQLVTPDSSLIWFIRQVSCLLLSPSTHVNATKTCPDSPHPGSYWLMER